MDPTPFVCAAFILIAGALIYSLGFCNGELHVLEEIEALMRAESKITKK
jgi:uncharacterized membrane protein YiaA